MIHLLLITAISLSCIAEYYAIMGLIAIFPGSPISIAVMGGILGLAKIVITSWLYRNWKATPIILKSYFLIAITILMLLTSMGIFGYLSKSHLEQNAISGEVLAKIEVYDEKIKIAKENIDANRKALKQLDEAVDQVMGRSNDEKGAEKAISIRRSQQKERARLQAEIQAEQKTISSFNEERAPIATEVRKVEAEVGPIKYIAALIYGDTADVNLLEKAVRWMIMLIVLVFDPLAVLMFVAYNQTVSQNKQSNLIVQQEKQFEHIVADLNYNENVGAEDEVEMILKNPYTGVERKIYST
jgi:hypothetical protein